MREINILLRTIIRLYIILNASELGWNVEIEENQIVLTKNTNLLTDLDKNTPKLINKLIDYSIIKC